MVQVPAGTFFMGSSSANQTSKSNELPLHEVVIHESFFVGKYEVTQAQWDQIMGSNPASNYGIGENYPVHSVNWLDCKDFIDVLNKIGFGTFRLPSESEWEYVCRAGTSTLYYWGNDYTESEEYAWHSYADGAKEVGLKVPNDWKLYDIIGNVWEWCEDDWHDDYVGAPEDGGAWIDFPRSQLRVYRGGAWHRFHYDLHSANRAFRRMDQSDNGVGLRLVRLIDESALNDWAVY